MFEKLNRQPQDKIMELMSLFAADSRMEKIDLGVGVYKDSFGNTPVMQSVKESEKYLLENQVTKKYVGLLGSIGFIDEMINLSLGTVVPRLRVKGAQAPGGTGALHQLFLLIRETKDNPAVWLSSPTWPNHPAILKHLGIRIEKYRYFDPISCEVDFEGMKEDLSRAQPGDVLLLHGCCHNPTGANLTATEWNEIANLCLDDRLIPLIDLAYQGFGDGLQQDVLGVQEVAKKVPEMLIASSCSKNFGIYRDRVGTAIVLAESNRHAELVEDNLKSLNRLTFSFPPDHGASVVEKILSTPDLHEQWVVELESMREEMLSLRIKLADALKRETNSDRFSFISSHRGMFSRLGLSETQVVSLREKFGIYMVSDSRINIAGLRDEKIDFLANSVAMVLKDASI
ncbi:MAG: amino acid aminotransferase [Pseudomonadota bacterium]|nr:amino acid aminotransferase [Pseudomonadota bacterium]